MWVPLLSNYLGLRSFFSHLSESEGISWLWDSLSLPFVEEERFSVSCSAALVLLFSVLFDFAEL